MRLTGAEIIVKAFEHEGVDTVFGFPGGKVLALYDKLYNSSIRHILVRHEQGAAHAAEGYARATGKPGVCIATSGPGATNLVTGIADAYMDSIPIIALTGQCPTSQIGSDAFQEADITGITLPIVKHSWLVRDVNKLAEIVRSAFHIATTGRPGPVLIDLPTDVADDTAEFEYPPPITLRGYHVKLEADPDLVAEAAKAIRDAKKPVIYAGGGVISSGASAELRELAERSRIPVTTTLLGKGAFPETHPLSLGMLGMHGTKYANYAISYSDLIIALGARFDDRITGKLDEFAPNARVIHIDIDPAEIGKNVRVHYPLVGDVKAVLRELLMRLEPPEIREWSDQVSRWKAEHPLTYIREGALKPQYIVEKIWEITNGDAIITTEVGQCQMWAAQYYKALTPRSFISSGGLGTMGFGLPAAIGAQAGCPERLVFDIAGDGSVQMTSQELATAVAHDLPIKVAILNNGYLGMVRQWQELMWDRRYSQTDLNVGTPDFVKLADAYGAVGLRVTRQEEVVPALEQAIATPKPVLIDFLVAREENVFPFVLPGAPLTKMLGG